MSSGGLRLIVVGKLVVVGRLVVQLVHNAEYRVFVNAYVKPGMVTITVNNIDC